MCKIARSRMVNVEDDTSEWLLPYMSEASTRTKPSSVGFAGITHGYVPSFVSFVETSVNDSPLLLL